MKKITKRQDINKEILERLINEGFTRHEMAEILNTTYSTIRSRIRIFNITGKSNHLKYSLNYMKDRRYGRLTVVDISGKTHVNKHGNTEKFYMCYCDCGNKKDISLNSLLRGYTKSCGCLRKELGKKFRGSHNNWKGCGDISGETFNKIKGCAKTRDIPFDLTIEYIWKLFLNQKKKCALTGLELKFRTSSYKYDGTASLDRIDSLKGYIEGNVQWVHKDINKMKQNLSDVDFIQYCKLVANHNP